MFVHLHVHSTFSVMDGVAQPEALVEAAARMGMPALALTEHRSMASAMKLCLACKAHGIKPIYGVEMDETDERELRSSKERKARGLRDYHLTLLAKNAAGVRNLFALVSEAALSGPKARTDLRVVRERGWGAGVIALTGCQGSRFAHALRAGEEQASAWYRALRDTFEQVYVEVQAHDVHGQDEVNRLALRFAADHHLPVVVTKDVHYVRPEDGRIHDFWVQVGRHAPYGSHAFYLAGPEQMRADAVRLGIASEALSATVALAEQIEPVDLTSAPLMPGITGPDGMSSEDCLMRLAYEGFFSMPRAKRSQRYRSRLEHELSVITAKGFAPYFLVLEDLLRWARSQGIAVGPGRGSAAGSLVAYLLGITRIDPLEHDLLFERFLNPERTSLPDVDIDVDASRRAEVLRYLAERYGADRVAQVSNYGREHLRSALKDAMRLLGFPFAQANALTRSIPSKWPDQTDVTLDQIMGLDGQVEEAIERWGKLAVDVARLSGDAIRKVARSEPAVLELAKAFEGLVRSYGVHAGGVVISPIPVVERCPLRAGQGKAVLPVTQWDLQDLEAAGLLKLDVLGLKTLSVIHLAEKMSGSSANAVDPNDPDLYRDLADGHTHGLFQAEGAAVRTIGQQMKPRRFQEVVDLLALARPGPMDARLDDGRTMVEHYLDARASGRMKRVHRSLEPILRKTYGVLVYQEQIMQIGQVMAGYTLAEADLLRRAIGKKKHDEMVKLREDFVKRSVQRGYDRAFAERLFGEIEKFAAYAFNRCVAGSTRVRKASANDKEGPEISIAEIYRRWYSKTSVGEKYRNQTHPKMGLHLLSLYPDGRIRKNRVVGVFYTGKQMVYRLRLAGGQSIDATLEHRFWTDRGFVRLGDLKPGDRVGTCGAYEPSTPEQYRRWNFTRDGWMRPKSRPYGSHRGFPVGDRNPAYVNGATKAFMERRQALLEEGAFCRRCGKEGGRLEVHHIDGDHTNQDPVNLTLYCSSCHKKVHYALLDRVRRGQKGYPLRFEDVIAVEPIGEVDTYDIEMAAPYHSYVANGIVTHNSHSASYACLLAQTLYLKQHAPAAFVAGLLTVDAGDVEKIAEHLAEARRLGIPVLPPDVNRSDLGFTLEEYQGRQAIRYGLLAVKGLGEQACHALIAQRPYTDLGDLLGRSFRRAVTVRHLMALAKAGALDSLAGGDRAQAIRSVNERRTKPEKLPPQISRSIWLQWEKEHLGAYLSGHPAEELPAGDGMEQGLIGALGGLVIGVRTHRDRKGQEMAFLRLDTVRGVFDVVVFARVWADARKAWASPGPGRQKLRRKTLALGDRVVVWAKRDETGKLLAERLRPAWHTCANDGDVPASQRREEAVSV